MSNSIVPQLQEFLRSRPDGQLLLVACLRLSEDDPNGTFWSSEALNLAQCQDRRPLTPLRHLGILQTVQESTRNYGNARYRARDSAGLRLAIVDMGMTPTCGFPVTSSTFTIAQLASSASWLRATSRRVEAP
jgi:hypothetical protein